jgi:hypothetical protein
LFFLLPLIISWCCKHLSFRCCAEIHGPLFGIYLITDAGTFARFLCIFTSLLTVAESSSRLYGTVVCLFLPTYFNEYLMISFGSAGFRPRLQVF